MILRGPGRRKKIERQKRKDRIKTKEGRERKRIGEEKYK